MKPMHFTALASVTALSLFAAWLTAPQSQTTLQGGSAGQLFFPDLGRAAQDLAALDIRAGASSIKVVKDPDGRFVEESSGYPIADKALRALIQSMSLAERAEAKTNDPARLAELNLETEAPDTREVILTGTGGKALAHLLIGKSDNTLGGAQGGQYLRLGGEEQAWLARARIELPSNRQGWFDTELISKDPAEITLVALTPRQGDPLVLQREQGSLRLASQPDAQLDSAKADRLLRMLASLRFTDMRKSDPAQLPSTTATASFESGESVTISLIESTEGGHWLRVETSSADLIAPARVKGVDFLLSSWSADPITWTERELLQSPRGEG